jgi:hypothetical protein
MELQGFSPPRSEERRKELARYVDRTFAYLELFPGMDGGGPPADGTSAENPLAHSIEESLAACKKQVRRCYDTFFGSFS